jgi:hypothetical protein
MARSWNPESRLPWNTICETLDSFVIQLRFLQSIALSGEAHIMGSIHCWDINIHESMFQCWVGIKNCIKPSNWLPVQFLRFIDHKLVGFSKKHSNNCSQNSFCFFACSFYEKLSVLSWFWNGNWNQWFFDSEKKKF